MQPLLYVSLQSYLLRTICLFQQLQESFGGNATDGIVKSGRACFQLLDAIADCSSRCSRHIRHAGTLRWITKYSLAVEIWIMIHIRHRFRSSCSNAFPPHFTVLYAVWGYKPFGTMGIFEELGDLSPTSRRCVAFEEFRSSNGHSLSFFLGQPA